MKEQRALFRGGVEEEDDHRPRGHGSAAKRSRQAMEDPRRFNAPAGGARASTAIFQSSSPRSEKKAASGHSGRGLFGGLERGDPGHVPDENPRTC